MMSSSNDNTHIQARYYEATGNPHSIVLEAVCKPVVVPGTVVVKVHVSAVNPVDFKVLKGSRWGQQFPFSPGYDIAGVVDSIGDGVTGFHIGDRVFGVNWGVGRHNGTDIPVVGGGFAEYSLVNATKLSHIPDAVSYEQAAAVALAGSTAYQVLFEQLHVKQGDRVMIIGGSSAVGQLAIQLAKDAGAVVYTTCSTRSISYVGQFHPDKIIDYTSSSYEDDVDMMHHMDAVFDTVGVPGTLIKAKKILKPHTGRFITITGGDINPHDDPTTHHPLAFASSYVLRNDVHIQDLLAEMIANDRLKVIIDDRFDFTKDGIVGIISKVAGGKSLGKNVLIVLRS